MGGGSGQSQTTSTAPWKGQQPYLTKGFEEAGKLYSQGPADYFPGQTYVDMAGQTQSGLNEMQTLAGQPSVVDSAASTLDKTLKGDFLNSNPYLDETYNTADQQLTKSFTDSTLPAIASMFGTQGATGNTSLDLAVGDASGQLSQARRGLANDIYGGNYQAERGRQQAAVDQAAGLREAQFGDASKLLDVGKRYEDQAARELEDKINRFNYGENAKMASLQDYMALVTGNYGSTSTTRQSSSGSPLATGLGGLAMLAGMF